MRDVQPITGVSIAIDRPFVVRAMPSQPFSHGLTSIRLAYYIPGVSDSRKAPFMSASSPSVSKSSVGSDLGSEVIHPQVHLNVSLI